MAMVRHTSRVRATAAHKFERIELHVISACVLGIAAVTALLTAVG